MGPLNVFRDYLQSYRFWLMDISTVSPRSGLVFNPLFGFRSVSAPEMALEIKSIKEGNNEFPRKVVEGASVSSITAERGSRFVDSDFWVWVRRAALGGFVPRRNLLLLQFFARTPWPAELGPKWSQGMIPGALRIPARAWFLRDCLPVRYKVATDFDATSAEISISSLEIDYEYFSEFSLKETLFEL